jgi:hypothetical protein
MESQKVHEYPAVRDNLRDVVVLVDQASDVSSESGRCDTIHNIYCKDSS